MTLRAYPVRSDADVEALRLIRNDCAGSFSHDNRQISHEEQEHWWSEMRGRVRAWLYATRFEEIVGYGLVRRDDGGTWWNSIAVLPMWRGLGYGSEITHNVLVQHPYPVWAQVREDNVAGLRMHHPDDWVEVNRAGGLVTFRSKER